MIVMAQNVDCKHSKYSSDNKGRSDYDLRRKISNVLVIKMWRGERKIEVKNHYLAQVLT